MSKTTNKMQMQHLLTLMEANTDIARGFHKGSKEAHARFWRNAETDLNALGPPSKCIAEWKKVWADQKKYVRQKAAQNLKNKKCTGGGPNKDQNFSATEEAMYNLIGMKASVEGVTAKTFGLTNTTMTEEILDHSEDMECMDNDLDIPEESVETTNNMVPSSGEKAESNCKKILPSAKQTVKSSYDALQAEIDIQKELLETVKLLEANQKVQDQNIKRIYRSLDKLGDYQRKHFKEIERLKRKQIEEMQRHNAFIEQLRIREVEYKPEKTRLQLHEHRSDP